MKYKIITISRLYGSGGRKIGLQLEEELKIKLYDKALFKEAAKNSDIHEAFFENAESYQSDMFANIYDSFSIGSCMPLSDKAFIEQANTIKRLASEGPCIIVGRGANKILEDMEGVLNIYIYSDIKKRKVVAINEYGVKAEKADKLIKSIDKNRLNYLKTYTNQNIGQCENYHLCLDSGELGIDNCVNIIKKAYEG